MIEFPCQVCRTSLSAEDAQAGQLVRCPTCLTTLRVPTPQRQLAGVSDSPAGTFAPPPPSAPGATYTNRAPPQRSSTNSGKRYGFNCAYCSSRLEVTESMAAQEG